MSSINLSANIVSPLASGALPGVPAVPALAIDDSDDYSFSFNDLLDVVNPLQHIPVVGTLYRAITGDTMNTAPKILGDTLYGGITGFVSSVADTIFEKVTGKSVGDTVLAMVEDVFSPAASDTAVARATPLALPAPAALAALPGNTDLAALESTPAAVTPAEQDAIVFPGQEELLTALNRAGIGQDVALRAADAYRRTLSVASAASNAALPNGFRASIAQ